MDVATRPLCVKTDLPAVLAINNACVPAVTLMTDDTMQELVGMADSSWVALLQDRVVGFIVCLRPGLNYASANYAWLSAKYPDFL